jgi:hypothetical protein
MADITELSAGAQAEFVKLRHKYLNGTGEIIQVPTAAGVLNDGVGTFPDTNYSCVVSARSTVLTDAPNLSREIELPSDSEAAKFQVGDTVRTFTHAGAVVSAAVTVEAVKGQKLLVTATNAALVPGQLVVRFDTGTAGGGTANVTDASAGLPYVGMGDAVAFLQAIQDNITTTVYASTACDVDSLATDSGIYSLFTSGLDIVSGSPDSMVGDLLTFATEPAALVGCTARIKSHTSGAATVLTVGDIRDSNGTFLGNQFPVVTTAAHSGGAGTGVTPTLDTTYTLTSGIADEFIAKILESSATPPARSAGQENSNDSGATTILINAMFNMIQKLDPDSGVAGEVVPADLEEELFGSMIKGGVANLGTAQGKRLRLAANAANDVTEITVEMDNAINDIPFPLSGTVRLQNNRGVGNTQGTSGVGISANLTYTRTKRSNVLTLGAVTGIVLTVGDIVELLPSHGQIMNGYAAQIDGKSMVTLMSVVRQCLINMNSGTIS